MNISEIIKKEADQCVKCGLCVPHCPTYQITHNECESPRGRIALMDGIASGQLPLTEKLESYLDHCLTCRACEAVCPSEVAYGKLITHSRAFIASQKKKKLPRLLALAVRYPSLFSLARTLLYIYQHIPLAKVGFGRIERFFPPLKKRIYFQPFYPAKTTQQGSVGLLTGCIHKNFDQETLMAAIKLLTAFGYDVHIPKQQVCCGALHLHAGELTTASHFADRNRTLFQSLNVSTLISTATGCSSVLKASLPVYDIAYFLNKIACPPSLSFKPLAKKIILHTPCTLRNVWHQSQEPFTLLQRIPGLTITPLSATESCCGAAGIYMLQQPQMADTLVNNLLKSLETISFDYLATTNLGCSLHLAAMLRKQNKKISVVHPILLLAQQINIKS